MGFADELRQTKPSQPAAQLDWTTRYANMIVERILIECRSAAKRGENSAEGYLYFVNGEWSDEYRCIEPADVRDFLKREKERHKKNMRFRDRKDKTAVPFSKSHSDAARVLAMVNGRFQSEGFSQFIFEEQAISMFPHTFYMYYFKARW